MSVFFDLVEVNTAIEESTLNLQQTSEIDFVSPAM